MAVFPRPAWPSAAIADLKAFLKSADRDHSIPIAILSILMPTLMIAGFLHDSYIPPQAPEMTFMPSWPADRSDAEIKAQQKIDEAARQAAVAERQRQFQKVEREFGL